MHYFQRLYLLKLLIFIKIFFDVSKGAYDDYLFVLKNKGFIYSSDYYKDWKDKIEALKKGRKYFKKCVEDTMINPKYFKKISSPLVSVIIPVYNAELKIKKAIRSIQNQNISNLEIILVNDYSTDKTIDVIKYLQKEDERIILIENQENKGILYTRCIGTLHASGKYIFPLDNDDLFFDEGIIDTIVNVALKDDYDIVEFNYAEYFNPKIPPYKLKTSEFGNHSHNLILRQPELSQFPRKKNNIYGVYDCYVWAKCIKATLYKNCINELGKKIYSKYILRGEDFIITFILFRLAQSFKFFGKYGIFRYKNLETAQYKSSRELYLLSRVIYLDIIRKFTENNINDKMYVVYFSDSFLKLISKELDILSDKNKIYFKRVLHKLLKDKYIKSNDKNRFISFFKNITWLLKK